jgi:hypothetical protein
LLAIDGQGDSGDIPSDLDLVPAADIERAYGGWRPEIYWGTTRLGEFYEEVIGAVGRTTWVTLRRLQTDVEEVTVIAHRPVPQEVDASGARR